MVFDTVGARAAELGEKMIKEILPCKKVTKSEKKLHLLSRD